MSSNKMRYYTVNQASTVRALNKGDALALARGRRGVSGQLIDEFNSVDRITADEAHNFEAAEFVAV